jgi:hypothetical protein
MAERDNGTKTRNNVNPVPSKIFQRPARIPIHLSVAGMGPLEDIGEPPSGRTIRGIAPGCGRVSRDIP